MKIKDEFDEDQRWVNERSETQRSWTTDMNNILTLSQNCSECRVSDELWSLTNVDRVRLDVTRILTWMTSPSEFADKQESTMNNLSDTFRVQINWRSTLTFSASIFHHLSQRWDVDRSIRGDLILKVIKWKRRYHQSFHLYNFLQFLMMNRFSELSSCRYLRSSSALVCTIHDQCTMFIWIDWESELTWKISEFLIKNMSR